MKRKEKKRNDLGKQMKRQNIKNDRKKRKIGKYKKAI